jgi:hypothetical protein
MNNKSFVHKLKQMDACKKAVEWVMEHGGTDAECWRDCERGDWMAWLAAKTPAITKRQRVGAFSDCAALSLKYYEAEYPNDKRVRECINTCRRYAQGKATDKELAAAEAASYASAYAAASYATASYASAAATAATASYASASASHYAAAYAAAAAAAYAAAAAASYSAEAASENTLKRCANIMRKHFPDLFNC